jgi:hypothetical protein
VLRSREDKGGKRKKEKGNSRVKQIADPGHCTTSRKPLAKACKLPRPKRPGYGKRTPRACKETGQRRRKENGTARKRTKEMEYGYK